MTFTSLGVLCPFMGSLYTKGVDKLYHYIIKGYFHDLNSIMYIIVHAFSCPYISNLNKECFMKQKKIFMMMLAFLLSIVANATTITLQGIKYELHGEQSTDPTNRYAYVVGLDGNATIVHLNIPQTIEYENNYGKIMEYEVRYVGKIVWPNGSGSPGAFKNNTTLESVKIPKSVKSIGTHAFYGCLNLKSVVIDNAELTIGAHAFNGCSNLENVDLGNSVKEIGFSSFAKCSNLANIDLPSSLETIEQIAFKSCSSLKNIIIPESVNSLWNGAFRDCSALSEVNIKARINIIDGSLFNGCTNLIKINIPTSVTSIGESAFANCKSLWSVDIPTGVTTIGKSAFSGCSNLETIVIPGTVNKIDQYAFSGITSNEKKANDIITHIYVDRLDPKEYNCASNVFSNNDFSVCRLHYPLEVRDVYKSVEPWKSFFKYEANGIKIHPASILYIIHGQNDSFTNQMTVEFSPNNVVVKDVEWESTNSDVVVVDNNGVAIPGSGTGKRVSHAYVKAKTIDGSNLADSCKVTMFWSPSDESFLPKAILRTNPTELSINDLGEIKKIQLTFQDDELNEWAINEGNVIFTWSSMDENIVRINNDGEAKAIGIGTTQINVVGTLTSGDVKEEWEANCKVTVKSSSENEDLVIATSETNKPLIEIAHAQGWIASDATQMTKADAEKVTDLGYAFHNNSEIVSLDELVFFTNLTSIPAWAFYGCSGLFSVNIPNHVNSIGDSAFMDCINLVSVNIPKSVTSISGSAFCGCSGLTSVNIPMGVTSIGGTAFCDCSSLTSVVIPNSVTSIGSMAFSRCSSLTSVSLPNNITSIDEYTFFCCSSLTFVSLPSNLTSIGDHAFDGCSELTSITIPNCVTSIGDHAFSDCSGLTSVTIPSNVTSIGGSVFSGCKNLTSVVIPNSVTSIGSMAFSRCSGLTSITIPNCVTSIGDRAFSNCSGLSSVTIPSSVTSIGGSAFSDCNNLTSVKVEIKDPLTINQWTFTNRTNAVLYVPEGSTEAYSKADYWKDFKEIKKIDGGDDDAELKDGDTFTAKTVEGIEMTFKVISATEKTCQVGGTEGLEASIDKEYSGSITIPETINGFRVVTVAFNAFSGSKINSVIIGNNVTYIDQNAFLSCQRLKSVTFPNNNGFRLKYWSFQGCPSLETITLPKNLTSMDGTPFIDCPSLTYIGVEDDNSNYKSIDGVVYSKDSKVIWAYPCGRPSTEYEIIDGTQVIGRAAFMSASKLEEIHIPNSVTRIDDSAFFSCTNLKTLILPPDLTSIPYGLATFSKITEISIPNKVTSIGNNAFHACHSLTSVRVEIEEPLAIDEYTFSNRANATLYVPKGCVDAYSKANYWKDFKQIIPIGDANGDGKINVADVVEVVNYLNGNPSERFNLDAVIQDGKVNTSIVLSEIMGKETTIDDSDEGGVVLYKSDEGHSFYCDGNYPYSNPDAIYFSQYLSGLNQNHFRIEFDYVPEAVGTVMVLSHGFRVLAINIDSNLCISIVTNNGNYIYPTQLACNLNRSNHLDLKFNNGNLTVNGKTFQVVMETGFDNELSSVNYSNAKTYKGWLKNIVVTSY